MGGLPGGVRTGADEPGLIAGKIQIVVVERFTIAPFPSVEAVLYRDFLGFILKIDLKGKRSHHPGCCIHQVGRQAFKQLIVPFVIRSDVIPVFPLSDQVEVQEGKLI